MSKGSADFGVVELSSKMVHNTTQERGDADTLPAFSLKPAMGNGKNSFSCTDCYAMYIY